MQQQTDLTTDVSSYGTNAGLHSKIFQKIKHYLNKKLLKQNHALCAFKKFTLLQKWRHSALGEGRRIPGTILIGKHNSPGLERLFLHTLLTWCSEGCNHYATLCTGLVTAHKKMHEGKSNSSELLNVNKTFRFPPYTCSLTRCHPILYICALCDNSVWWSPYWFLKS